MDPHVPHRDCLLVSHKCASKQVLDMHYEARVGCVRNWYVEKRKIKMKKNVAKDIIMQPWQYFQVVSFPYYRLGDRRTCFHYYVYFVYAMPSSVRR